MTSQPEHANPSAVVDHLGASQLFWIARDAMVVYHYESHGIVQWNPAAERLLGYTAEEVQGKNLADLFPARTRNDAVARLTGRYIAGGTGTDCDDGSPLEIEVLDKQGSVKAVEFTATPFTIDHSAYFVIIFRDCTERRRLERERTALLTSAQEHSRRVSELATLKADFTAMVAHELGNPIAAIAAMAQLLERASLSDEQRMHIRKALRAEAAMLQRLVEDVRTASLMERRDFAVELKPVPLQTLVADAVASLHVRGGDNRLDVADMPVVQVMADQERITQVIQNLVGNAFKHTPAGTHVWLRADQVDGVVNIAVSDDGPGIHPDDLTRIFTKFGRGRDTEGNRVPGVGLGLYLARRIIQAHDGELAADSELGKSTTFRFSLKEVRA